MISVTGEGDDRMRGKILYIVYIIVVYLALGILFRLAN